ncbi:MAG: mechanosensitive ion channel family protein [Actinomycetota bacterium]
MGMRSLRNVRAELVRVIAGFTVAIAAAVVADTWGQWKRIQLGPRDFDPAEPSEKLVVAGAAIVLLVAGVIGVRAVAAAVRKSLQEHAGDERVAPLGLIVTLVGYLIVALSVLGVFEVNFRGFLVGGALTGVILGIAGQQVLANMFAGIVLLANRPFTIGDFVVMRSGALGGEYKGVVTNMSLFYVDIHTGTGPVSLPNAGVLAAAIGPGAAVPEEEEEEDAKEAKKEEEQAPPSAGGAPSDKPPGA